MWCGGIVVKVNVINCKTFIAQPVPYWMHLIILVLRVYVKYSKGGI